MPQLEPELGQLTVRKRPPPNPSASRKLELYYRDKKGRLQLWSPLWPVLPLQDFDPLYDIYLIFDHGDAVLMRATMEKGQVMCTQISPNGAPSFTVSSAEFANLCLAAVQTTLWRPGTPSVQQGHGVVRREAGGQP